MDRNVNDNFKFNQETEFVPILGQVATELNRGTRSDPDPDSDSEKSGSIRAIPSIASSVQENHHPALLSLLAQELTVAPADIHDFELYVSILLQNIRHLTIVALFMIPSRQPLED